jgi:TolA-binding protein
MFKFVSIRIIFVSLLISLLALNNVYCQAKSEVDTLIKYADGLVTVYNYGKAREIYSEVLFKYPGNNKEEYLQFMICKCFALEGGWGYWYAAVEFEKFLNKYPNSTYAEEAKKLLSNCKKVVQWGEDGDGQIPLFSVEEKLAQKYINFGIDFIYRIVETGEGGYPVYKQEELEQAIYWFNKVITEFPNIWYAAKAQYYIGEAYSTMGRPSDYEKAVTEYQKVLDNYPDTLFFKGYRRGALRKIGDIYQKKIFDKKLAIAAYQKLLELEKDNPDSFYASYARAQLKYLK